MSIKNSREKSNQITIKRGDDNKVKCKLFLSGRSKHLERNVSISFPPWLTPQANINPYIKVNRHKNGFDINIAEMLNDQKRVTIDDHIDISLISNTPHYKTSFVSLQWQKKSIFDFLKIKIKSEGITLINEERKQ